MKPHEHMLRGYEKNAQVEKAIGILRDYEGRVCAVGAYLLSANGDAEDYCGWTAINTPFFDAYGIGIAQANNGVGEAILDENGQPGLSIPTIAGMLKAIDL